MHTHTNKNWWKQWLGKVRRAAGWTVDSASVRCPHRCCIQRTTLNFFTATAQCASVHISHSFHATPPPLPPCLCVQTQPHSQPSWREKSTGPQCWGSLACIQEISLLRRLLLILAIYFKYIELFIYMLIFCVTVCFQNKVRPVIFALLLLFSQLYVLIRGRGKPAQTISNYSSFSLYWWL